jgi:hypothetical protein
MLEEQQEVHVFLLSNLVLIPNFMVSSTLLRLLPRNYDILSYAARLHPFRSTPISLPPPPKSNTTFQRWALRFRAFVVVVVQIHVISSKTTAPLCVLPILNNKVVVGTDKSEEILKIQTKPKNQFKPGFTRDIVKC